MARTWEQEKAYSAKRAEQLTAEMEASIQADDFQRFDNAYKLALRYMTKKQRMPYYMRMLERRVEANA